MCAKVSSADATCQAKVLNTHGFHTQQKGKAGILNPYLPSDRVEGAQASEMEPMAPVLLCHLYPSLPRLREFQNIFLWERKSLFCHSTFSPRKRKMVATEFG